MRTITFNKESAGIESLSALSIPRAVGRLYAGRNHIEKIEGIEHLGLLSELKLQENSIPKIEGLEKHRLLTDLDLSGNFISKIENLDNQGGLKYLKLNNNQISKIENLNNKQKLKVLELSGNKISTLECLNNLPSLESLRLNDNNILSIESLDGMPNLKVLELAGNNISILKNLEKLENLEKLVLSGNPITKVEGIQNLSKLKTLKLENCEIRRIENLENNQMLEELNLSGNAISELRGLDQLKRLKRFSIASNELQNLAGLPNNKTLYALDFQGNNLQNLDGIEKCGSLFHLNLTDNPGLPSEYQKKLEDESIVDIYMLQNTTPKQIEEIYKAILGHKFSRIFSQVSRTRPVLLYPDRKLMVDHMSKILTKLRFSDPNVCLYCHKSIGTDERASLWLRNEVNDLIDKVNRKLPSSRKVKDSHNTLVDFDRYYIDMFRTTVTNYKGVESKRLSHKVDVGKINSIIIPVLIDPLCKSCAKNFYKDVKKIMKSIRTRGKYKQITSSVKDAFLEYEALMEKFITG